MGKNTMLRSMLLIIALLSLAIGVTAQDSRAIEPGVQINGEISTETPAQVYTYAAAEGDIISIGITSDPGLTLTILVTDAAGSQLASSTGAQGSGSVTALNIALTAGTNYVTVFPAAISAEQTGRYRLSAQTGTVDAPPVVETTPEQTDVTPTEEAPATEETPEATPEVDENDGFQLGQVLTSIGLQVTLDWQSTADLNLEIRDPTGQRLFFDSRTNANGGVFGFDVNGLCEVLNNPAQETATYSPGAIPAGSYEILVYYRQNCENNGPQPFTVNVMVDGVNLAPITGTLQPPVNGATVYVGSFIVNMDGTAILGESGPYPDIRTIPATLATAIGSAPRTPLVEGIPTRAVINGPRYYDLYSFEGSANQIISVSMSRLSGNLDTLLLVLDPNNVIIADNDDIVAGNITDSAINNPPVRLASDGIYTIIATRYGKDVGGTAGEYEILVQSQSAELPQDLLDLGLPTGDIQVTLLWDTNADLQLLVRDPRGDSVYDDALSVASGGRMSAQGNLNCVATLTTPVSHIYWPPATGRGGSYEIEVWYQNQCNDTRAVNATLYITVAGNQVGVIPVSPLPGQRFVTSFVLDGTGTASLGAGGIIGGSETLNYAAEIETAPVILSSQIINGSITSDNKFDVYAFEGQAGQRVTIRMAATQGSLDPLLFLVSPSFFEVASNDDAIPGSVKDSLIEAFTLPETGRYYILATHFATIYGGTTGTYSLTMTLQ